MKFNLTMQFQHPSLSYNSQEDLSLLFYNEPQAEFLKLIQYSSGCLSFLPFSKHLLIFQLGEQSHFKIRYEESIHKIMKNDTKCSL